VSWLLSEILLSRAFRERGRATLLPGGFSGWGVVRRHARGCDAAATRGGGRAAAQQAQPNLGSIAPPRRRRARRRRGVRRRTVRSRSGSKRYVQRVDSGRCALRVSPALGCLKPLGRMLLRVAHAPNTQDDPSGPLVRDRSRRRRFWWGGSRSRCPRNHGKVKSATNRSLRQRIATQHSVGHEETRMPLHVGARLGSPAPRASRSRRSGWLRWPAVVTPSRRRRTYAGKSRILNASGCKTLARPQA
jgi:hypothetical protein